MSATEKEGVKWQRNHQHEHAHDRRQLPWRRVDAQRQRNRTRSPDSKKWNSMNACPMMVHHQVREDVREVDREQAPDEDRPGDRRMCIEL
jgi:hypothetical protein